MPLTSVWMYVVRMYVLQKNLIHYHISAEKAAKSKPLNHKIPSHPFGWQIGVGVIVEVEVPRPEDD